MHGQPPKTTTRGLLATTSAIALLLASAGAGADAVYFKNGDRLTGELVDAPKDFVAIAVPDVGTVTVPRAQVERLAKEAAPQPGGADPESAGPPSAASGTESDVLWRARADLGMSVTTGNTRVADLKLVAGVERRGERFDNRLGVAVHKARANVDAPRSTAGSTTTQDQIDFDYNLRWKYRDDWYAVANFEYFEDPIKDVDRATTGTGVGHTFWETDRGLLRTDAGVNWVFEEIRRSLTADSEEAEHNPALRWGLQFNRWLVADRLELFHNNRLLHIFANEPSSVWNSDTGVRFHVNSRWLAALRMDFQHETAPATGRRKTDSSYAVAVGVKL